MIWPFRHPAAVKEAERLQAEINTDEIELARIRRQWPTVQSLGQSLVERRVENGFGEELEVAWTPRNR